jgi:hypothetical protein
MQQRLRNLASSEAKIDAAALFGYGHDGKQVCGRIKIKSMLLARDSSW